MVTKKLKILFISEISHIGGASTAMEEISNELVRLGHEVFIIQGLDREQKNWSVNYLDPRVEILNYKTYFYTNISVFLSLLVGTFNSLSLLNKNHKFDVLYLNGTFSAGVACLHPLYWRVKKIFLFHGDDVEIFRSVNFYRKRSIFFMAKKFPFLLLLYIAQKITIKMSDYVICFSKYSCKYVLKRFKGIKNKSCFTYLGVNPYQFKPSSFRFLLKEKMGFHRSLKIILCTSRFEPRKGIELLIESFSQLIKYFPKSLLILTTSADKYSLKSDYHISLIEKISKLEISSHVRILYNLTRVELVKFYQIANIHILPSKHLESFPLVILESLACGTPVATFFNSGGSAEVVNSLSSKLIFSNFNSYSLTKSIFWFLNLNRQERLRNKALNLAGKFRWTESTHYLLSLSIKNI